MGEAVKHLEIKDCDPKLAQMFKIINAAYRQNLRFSFEANFSGNPADFKYFFNKIDAKHLVEIIEDTVRKETHSEIL